MVLVAIVFSLLAVPFRACGESHSCCPQRDQARQTCVIACADSRAVVQAATAMALPAAIPWTSQAILVQSMDALPLPIVCDNSRFRKLCVLRR